MCASVNSVAKCAYLSVVLRKFEVFSAVRKIRDRIRKIEQKIKNESTSASGVVITALHQDQGPCLIESQCVEYRLAEESEKLCQFLWVLAGPC